jgi:hypothetical protein
MNPFGNSTVSNPSGEKEMVLFDLNKFEISVPQCPTHYSRVGNDDMLDIVVRQEIRVSDITVSNILYSENLPIVFHILDHIKIRNLSEHVEIFIDWERFQSLASELISPRIEIISGVEADKAPHDFTACSASAYRLSTSKVTLSDINNDLPGLDQLLKQKQRVRKLWHETKDAGCKTAVNWVMKSIRQMIHKKSLEWWGKKYVTLRSHLRLYGPLQNPS